MTAPRSLKARALQWLAQREQSRVELRRKLLPYAVAEAESQANADADAGPGVPSVRRRADAAAGMDNPLGAPMRDVDEAPATPAAQVDALLDWLEAHRYLSSERFVESRVHARAARFGNLRIRQELKQHQVELTPEAALGLKASELERAAAVRERKFAQWPANAAERARQSRFLAGRGFSPEVISRVLRASPRAMAADPEEPEAGNTIPG